VVCTDDLSMAAARQMDGRTLSYTEAVITALQAGCDLALLCNRSAVNSGAELDDVLDQLAEAQLKGRWTPSEISEERRLGLLPVAPPRDWESLVRSADYMRALDLLP
jgi:beta-N-acetylhexosaminidase